MGRQASEKGVSSSRKIEEMESSPLKMETNEALKTTVVQEAEAEIMKLLKRVQEMKVGDLKGVEQEVLKRMFAQIRNRISSETRAPHHISDSSSSAPTRINVSSNSCQAAFSASALFRVSFLRPA